MSSPILVVDDDPAVLRGVGTLLEQSGYTVHCAASGAHAIDFLDSPAVPALVVLDVLMPVCDGFEVCRYLRQLPTYIPVLMLSARDDVFDKVLGLEIGADDYLTKPFAPRELLARVRALLRFKQCTTGYDADEPQLVFGPIMMWPTVHRAEVSPKSTR